MGNGRLTAFVICSGVHTQAFARKSGKEKAAFAAV
jgi:hypothetical protein